MGDKDFVKPLLERRGRIFFGKVCMKPGKPLTFALVRTAGRSRCAARSMSCAAMCVLPGERLCIGARATTARAAAGRPAQGPARVWSARQPSQQPGDFLPGGAALPEKDGGLAGAQRGAPGAVPCQPDAAAAAAAATAATAAAVVPQPP